MAGRRVDGVFWASWKGKRIEELETGELVSLPNGNRWGHWFIAPAEIADREAPLRLSALTTWGELASTRPKSRAELAQTVELVGVRLLALRSEIPFCYSGDKGGHNLAASFPVEEAQFFLERDPKRTKRIAKEEEGEPVIVEEEEKEEDPKEKVDEEFEIGREWFVSDNEEEEDDLVPVMGL